jgi:predicted esterase
MNLILAALLQRAGADATLRIENAGHALTDNTAEVVRRWLNELSK